MPDERPVASHGAQWNIGSTPFTISARPSSEVMGDVKPSTAAVMKTRFVDQRRHAWLNAIGMAKPTVRKPFVAP